MRARRRHTVVLLTGISLVALGACSETAEVVPRKSGSSSARGGGKSAGGASGTSGSKGGEGGVPGVPGEGGNGAGAEGSGATGAGNETGAGAAAGAGEGATSGGGAGDAAGASAGGASAAGGTTGASGFGGDITEEGELPVEDENEDELTAENPFEGPPEVAGGPPPPVDPCMPPCDAGSTCQGNACVVNAVCAREDIPIRQNPPNMLITLDRSCSMKELVQGKPKWTSAVKAVFYFTKEFLKKIRFGLELFPDINDGQDCKMEDPLQAGITDKSGAKIRNLLKRSLAETDKYYPKGPCTTPIDFAVEKAEKVPSLSDGKHASYAILVTDGGQSACNGSGDAGTTAAIKRMYKEGIGTFILSFGTGAGIDEKQLNIWADAGGYPVSASIETRFYQAENQKTLRAALNKIAAKAISCEFTLSKPIPDEKKLFVFTDFTKQIKRDKIHAVGWDYEPVSRKVTLYGLACEGLRQGSIKAVNVVYGCADGSTVGAGGASSMAPVCSGGKPSCDKNHLCALAADGLIGTCNQGCCQYAKD